MTITEYRKKHGMSVEQLAEKCGINRTTLAMVETGGGCRLLTAKRIVTGTGGEIAYEDLLVDPADAENGEQEANGSSGA